MNIVDEIRNNINDNPDFFSPYLTNEYKQSLRKNTLNFLNSKDYRELEAYSKLPRTISYNIHGKSGKLSPLEDIMNKFELYEEYGYRHQRLHYPHLLNVYLLGLYIFNNSPIIQQSIIKKISQEPNDIWVKKLSKRFHFSAESPFGEFYYRWRLASLCHDFGYPFELSSNDKETQMNVFSEINSTTSIGINSIKDLLTYGEVNLFEQLDERIEDFSLANYIETRENEPMYENNVYDHGIYGALLFIRMMHSHFKYHPEYMCRDDGTRIVSSPELLSNSLLSVTVAIAKHNLDSDEKAFLTGLGDNEINLFNLNTDPLSYLLKLCDEIQEWYKFEANTRINKNLYNRKLNEPLMRIKFEKNRIIVIDIDKKEKIENKLNQLLEPSIIEFR